MSGLLSGVLPFLYSQGDRLKRRVGGLLSDPLGTMEQTAGGIEDAHREQQGLLGQAFGDKARPFKVTDDAAMQQAAMNMLQGPLGFAPAGMIRIPGRGQIPETADEVNSLTARLERLLDKKGIQYERDSSAVSPSQYFNISPYGPQEEFGAPLSSTFKARISNHPDYYASDYSVSKTDVSSEMKGATDGRTFEELLRKINNLYPGSMAPELKRFNTMEANKASKHAAGVANYRAQHDAWIGALQREPERLQFKRSSAGNYTVTDDSGRVVAMVNRVNIPADVKASGSVEQFITERLPQLSFRP